MPRHERRGRVNSTRAQRSHIIFDFDGTITNTLPLVIELVATWSVTDVPLTIALIEELRGMPAQQALKHVGIPLYRVPRLLMRGRRELMTKLKDAQPFDHILDVIKKLSMDHDLFVMSSNSSENINRFLKAYNVAGCFTAVYGNVSIFGKTKVLKRIIKDYNLTHESCIYVGDETRDIEAAHRLKMPVVSVTWGYNNKQILSQYQPDYLIDKPTDLLQIFQA
jgi:phosphoglycolate phosphatase-like HAD superfamily hydrolase